MQFSLLVVGFVAAIHAANGGDHLLAIWNSFKRTHGKQYSDAREEQHRLAVFKENVAMINRHNLEADRGLHSYRLAINQFADMTHKEFARTMLAGLKPSRSRRSTHVFTPSSNYTLPAAVDWRTKGVVTDVIENQGECGSCWALTATGALEGQHAIKTGNLVRLSAQNLIDCSSSFGNYGCNGGLMDYAYLYIKANDGIDTEASYPYEAKDGDCRFKRDSVGATDTGYVDLPVGNETTLQIALALVGPMGVGVDAGQESFRFYSSGVYDEPACRTTQLLHSFIVVGYDTFRNATVSQDYYIAKNSWGDKWGLKGYIWMSRNKNNQCGIATMAGYPTV